MSRTLDVTPPYTARAIKASGLVEETKALLRAWRPGETPGRLRRRVREEGLLGRATASRSDDVVAHAFNQRFLSGPRPAAPLLQRLLRALGPGRWFLDLCLLYAARADVVLRESIVLFAAERRGTNRGIVDAPGLVGFLEEQEARGRMQRSWSPGVKLSVAQHVLRQMTDFGLAGSPRRGVRQLLPFEPTAIGVAWLAHDLHFEGLTDSRVVGHPDWSIWSLPESRTRDRIAQLARPGLWEVQAAGSLVEIAWSSRTMEEAVDVIARIDLR